MSGNTSFTSFHVKAGIVVLLAMLLAACGPSEETAGQSTSAGPKSLIYSWMSDPNKEVPNFLAVIDADSASPTYGTILKTVAAGEVRGHAHHSNFTLPYSGMLFTNDFFGDGTYIFDTAMVPHWLSPDQAGERIVVLGFGPQLINRVMLVNFDSETGKLEIDEAFGGGNEAGPGLITANLDRPGGERGPAIPHGSVFWPSADPSWKN